MIYGILLLSLILRVIVFDQSLWWDEAINVVAAKNLNLGQFIFSYPIGDFHPPGYFFILWIWTHLFGFSEVVVRIPSVILALITAWLTFLLGKKMFGEKVGLLAAYLLAIAPLHVYYSQEARMYALAAFSTTLCFYFFTKLNEKRYLTSVGFILGVVLVLYSDYLAYLIFPAQLLYILWSKKIALKKFLKFFGVSLLFLIPILPIFLNQLATGRETAASLPAWANVVGGANIKELLLVFVKTSIGRVSLTNKLIYGALMAGLGLFYLIIIAQALKKFDSHLKLLVLWITIPLILAFFISSLIPVLAYFRMLFILPAFYLLLAKGLTSLPKIYFKPAIFLVMMISLFSLSLYYTNPKFQREDWRGALSLIKENISEGDLVLFENTTIPSPALYYFNSSHHLRAALAKVPVSSFQDIKEFPNIETIYLFEYLVEITDPKRLLEKRLIDQGFKEKKIYNFEGVGFVTKFSRF